jgi:predicted dehydrogenase
MSTISRRNFLARSVRTTALAAAAATYAAPACLPAGSPNNRVEIALVGAGGRGRTIIRQMAALRDVHVKYICDVEDAHASATVAEVAKIQGSQPKPVGDLRRVLDDPALHGVIVATPEQWHALAAIWACQAGKDVYVEKNITLSIWEGQRMIEAVEKYKRVLQVGTQNRSWSPAFTARQYIKSGELGKVLYVKVYGMLPDVVGGYQEHREPDGPVPPGLDWDRWLGPARLRPYNRHVHRKWYGYWDFSGGNTSDALHTLDLARIVLGDPPHPTLVECMGGRYQMDDGGDMPDVQIVAFQYDRLVMSFFNTGFTPYYQKAGPEIRLGAKFPFWPQNADRIEVFGTKRLMYVGRHGAGWQVFEKDGKLVAQDKAPHADPVHLPNFIDCIRSRKQPNGNIRQGHASACLEHLANIAYRTGNQRLTFDPKTETFVGSAAANGFLKPYYREPYRVPEHV